MKPKLDYLKKKLIYLINLAKLIFKNHMSVLVWKVQISLQILQVLNG